jgi:hypothetical protein
MSELRLPSYTFSYEEMSFLYDVIQRTITQTDTSTEFVARLMKDQDRAAVILHERFTRVSHATRSTPSPAPGSE